MCNHPIDRRHIEFYDTFPPPGLTLVAHFAFRRVSRPALRPFQSFFPAIPLPWCTNGMIEAMVYIIGGDERQVQPDYETSIQTL